MPALPQQRRSQSGAVMFQENEDDHVLPKSLRAGKRHAPTQAKYDMSSRADSICMSADVNDWLSEEPGDRNQIIQEKEDSGVRDLFDWQEGNVTTTSPTGKPGVSINTRAKVTSPPSTAKKNLNVPTIPLDQDQDLSSEPGSETCDNLSVSQQVSLAPPHFSAMPAERSHQVGDVTLQATPATFRQMKPEVLELAFKARSDRELRNDAFFHWCLVVQAGQRQIRIEKIVKQNHALRKRVETRDASASLPMDQVSYGLASFATWVGTASVAASSAAVDKHQQREQREEAPHSQGLTKRITRSLIKAEPQKWGAALFWNGLLALWTGMNIVSGSPFLILPAAPFWLMGMRMLGFRFRNFWPPSLGNGGNHNHTGGEEGAGHEHEESDGSASRPPRRVSFSVGARLRGETEETDDMEASHAVDVDFVPAPASLAALVPRASRASLGGGFAPRPHDEESGTRGGSTKESGARRGSAKVPPSVGSG